MTAPTREQVVQWALEAGFTVRNGVIKAVHSNGSWVAVNERLAEFAALAFAAGQTAEREACAKACDTLSNANKNSHYYWDGANWCAELIRARGTA